jgi:group II intron reverse transcriptase/maturase
VCTILLKRANITTEKKGWKRVMQTSMHGIAEAAKVDTAKRFCDLYSFFNRVVLEQAYRQLNKDAVAGVDEITYLEYGKNLEVNLISLEERLKQKRYWPRYVKRVEIPKPNGKTRTLGIPTLEDKIVQKVAADILTILFEPIFLPCSYGYRPDRSAKQAVTELQVEIRGKYAWVMEADIQSYFDTINHEQLLKMVEYRVNDKAFIGLISRFLKSGILTVDGTIQYPEQGTPQGGIISPVLANIYLHYVLDEWFIKEIKPKGKGEALLSRYADDFIAAFQYHNEAQEFSKQLVSRFNQFGLTLSKEKSRKILFSRFRMEESKTFTFLGFTFRRIRTRRGLDTVSAKMSRERIRRSVKEFSLWCKKHRNKRIAWIMGMVKAKLLGIKIYFKFPGYSERIRELYYLFKQTLYRWLNRRSERKSYNWKTFKIMWNQFNVESYTRNIADGIQLSFINKLL